MLRFFTKRPEGITFIAATATQALIRMRQESVNGTRNISAQQINSSTNRLQAPNAPSPVTSSQPETSTQPTLPRPFNRS